MKITSKKKINDNLNPNHISPISKNTVAKNNFIVLNESPKSTYNIMNDVFKFDEIPKEMKNIVQPIEKDHKVSDTSSIIDNVFDENLKLRIQFPSKLPEKSFSMRAPPKQKKSSFKSNSENDYLNKLEDKSPLNLKIKYKDSKKIVENSKENLSSDLEKEICDTLRSNESKFKSFKFKNVNEEKILKFNENKKLDADLKTQSIESCGSFFKKGSNYKNFNKLYSYMDVYNSNNNSSDSNDYITKKIELHQIHLELNKNVMNVELLKAYNQVFKVSNCTYITKAINPKVYVCNCSIKELFIICEECTLKCHAGHQLIPIDNTKLNFTCNCGEERHPEKPEEGDELVNLSSKCIISSLFTYATPRMFFKQRSRTDISSSGVTEIVGKYLTEASIKGQQICGFCFVSNVSETKNFSDYDFTYEDENEEYFERKYCDLSENITTCNCKVSLPIPIKALLTYYESIFALKNGKFFSRLIFCEHNINLLTVTKELFSVYSELLGDIKNFYECLKKDEKTFFVEDQDLLRVYVSMFSILSHENSFSYIRVIDIFSFLNLDAKIKIIKMKVDQFSSRNFNQDLEKNKEENSANNQYTKTNIVDGYNLDDIDKFHEDDYDERKKRLINRRTSHLQNPKSFASNMEKKVVKEDKSKEQEVKERSSQELIESVNEYFFSIYQFYIYIRNFFFKYNNNFNVFTILNMHIYQRKLYIYNCLDFARLYLTRQEIPQYEFELAECKIALANLPDLYIDWYEKILNTNLFKFFSEDLDVYVFFFDCFTFLCKYDLLSDTTRIRLYTIIVEILLSNIEKNIKSNGSKIKDFIYLKLDKIFEIVYYGFCYYNDKIVLSKISKQTNQKTNFNCSDKNYCYKNSENEEEKLLLSKIFTYSIENIDLLFSQLNFVKDKRIKVNLSKINCIIKRLFDIFIGNKHTEESESYLLSIKNLWLFNYKISLIFNVKDNNKSNEFLSLSSKLIILNNDYFQFNLKIENYIVQVSNLINEEINTILKMNSQILADIYKNSNSSKSSSNNFKQSLSLMKVLPSIKNISSFNQSRNDSNYNDDKKQNIKNRNSLENVQLTFKITNFIVQFKQLLHIISNALHFFQQAILKENELTLLMDFIILCVYNDYENLVILSGCDYFKFFDVFKDNGIKNFLLLCSSFYYKGLYQFDNYIFITNLIILYFYYIDPNDLLNFEHYYSEFSKFEVIQKRENFIKNLNHYSFDDFYTINLQYNVVTINDLIKTNNNIAEANLLTNKPITNNEYFIKNEYPKITDPEQYWTTRIARMTRFFLFLEYLIDSNDFPFEENLRLYELVNFKISNMPISIDIIFQMATSKANESNCEAKMILEDYLYHYYKFFNMLFKRGLYQLEILKDNLKFISPHDLENLNFNI